MSRELRRPISQCAELKETAESKYILSLADDKL